MNMIKDEEYTKLLERIIEANYYIYMSASKGEYDKLSAYRKELNTLIDMVLETKISK